MAHINKTKVKTRSPGKEQEPDERLMRSIEEKIDIPSRVPTTSAAASPPSSASWPTKGRSSSGTPTPA
jgi:hypothetical protein